MINTYQTSLAPPPLPPRLSRGHPVLIPEPLAPRSHGKPLLRLLAGVVILHFFLSVAGFIYLYNNEKMEKRLSEGKAKGDYYSSERQVTFKRILARMIVQHWPQAAPRKPTPGYLKWDTKNSVLKGVNYFNETLLTVQQTGDYYVYSKVTFSKAAAKSPLVGEVKLRTNDKDQEAKTVMQTFCNLGSGSGSGNTMCTASQGQVMALEQGNQLGVWVEDLSLVNYGEASTTFGMYKL